MTKNILIIFTILFLTSCSFDTRSGIWTKENISLNSKENRNIKELFKKEISDKRNKDQKILLIFII